MKILIGDDERNVEDLFRQKLQKEIRSGMLELEFAFSGKEALDILASENPPRIVYVFSDINLPGMSGLEMLDIIKERIPQIQVSMISAYGDEADYKKAMDSGAKEFYTKSVNFENLKKEITSLSTSGL